MKITTIYFYSSAESYNLAHLNRFLIFFYYILSHFGLSSVFSPPSFVQAIPVKCGFGVSLVCRLTYRSLPFYLYYSHCSFLFTLFSFLFFLRLHSPVMLLCKKTQQHNCRVLLINKKIDSEFFIIFFGFS